MHELRETILRHIPNWRGWESLIWRALALCNDVNDPWELQEHELMAGMS